MSRRVAAGRVVLYSDFCFFCFFLVGGLSTPSTNGNDGGNDGNRFRLHSSALHLGEGRQGGRQVGSWPEL